jgi:hypothetical protein
VLRKLIIIVIVLLVPFIGICQIVPPPVPPPPPPGLPIDGFSGLLFIIGLFFGGRKILKS